MLLFFLNLDTVYLCEIVDKTTEKTSYYRFEVTSKQTTRVCKGVIFARFGFTKIILTCFLWSFIGKSMLHTNRYVFFYSYAFFHATRKTFSNVKSTISDEWSPSFHNDTVNYTKPDHVSYRINQLLSSRLKQCE